MAENLGFDAATANSIDTTSDRDFAIEFVNALSLLSVAFEPLGRGDDSVFFAGIWLCHLPEAYSTGSSAMPQKKNPDLAGTRARQS
jgi:argininosuccinate lyase